MITCVEMQEVEAAAFARGASAEALMEKVGRRMASVILRDHVEPGRVIAFLGKGHNAGDALVVARHLKDAGWAVEVRTRLSPEEMAPLTRKKWEELGEEVSGFRRGAFLLLDGLLGIGASGVLREPLAGLAQEMNALRRTAGARTVAMDLPSGLDADTGEAGVVVADWTFTVGIPKKGLVADSATNFVGRLELIEVEELPVSETGDALTTASTVRSLLPPRPFSFHKGQAGRVTIIAGSPGLVGAAVLCAQGSLRAGGGLITLLVEECDIEKMLRLVPPEIMVKARPDDWREIKADAIVIGPGLGRDSQIAFRLIEYLEAAALPTILDADGLNMIADARRLDLLKEDVLVTPHPGELQRLVPAEGTRAERALQFTDRCPATLLFKGARTIVTQADEPLFYNTTGNPGMATGGQGDTLSGVLGSLVAGGLTLIDAARAGAWLTGRAAEVALLAGRSELSLTPSDIGRHLGL